MKNFYLALVTATMIAGCDNAANSNKNSTPVPQPNSNNSSQYTFRNGSCYSNSTGQQVNASLCNNSNNSNGNGSGVPTGYELRNGLCYSSTTGQQVVSYYCVPPSNGNGNRMCYGPYIFTQNGNQQFVTCNGSNCSGYMLVQPSTGAPVYCQ